jgi:tRNA dimethylallyltransferase
MNSPDPTLYIITGPTASGKTALALEWAQRMDAEILSCDSLLVYQGMDIGTAKPDASERRRIPHHLIDLVPVHEPYDVGRYLLDAQTAIADIHRRGKRVLICGGSGFYLKAFFAPVTDPEPISPEASGWAEQLFEKEGLKGAVKALSQLSPDDLHLIDLQNPRRVLPALKRCKSSGLSLTALRERLNQADFPFAKFPKRTLCLTRADTSLLSRIRQRTATMLKAGLIDEVRALIPLGLKNNPSARTSIGYRECLIYLKKTLSLPDLEATINQNTWKLVQKQKKWFRHQLQPELTLDLDQTPNPDWH